MSSEESDPTQGLPLELWADIFYYLSSVEICRAGLVHTTWYGKF